jgi:hypothetical protein
MKKVFLLLLLLTVAGGFAFSLNILSFPPPLNGGGEVMVDASVGLAAYGGDYSTISVPPLFVNVEYAVHGILPVSLGVFGTFFINDYKDNTNNEELQNSFFTIGGKGNWHWGFDVKWLDIYTGMWIGYRVSHQEKLTGSHNDADGATSKNDFDYGYQIGAHFYLLKNLGLTLEFGYPFVVKTGATLKFKG